MPEQALGGIPLGFGDCCGSFMYILVHYCGLGTKLAGQLNS